MSDPELDRLYQEAIDSGEYRLGLLNDKNQVVLKFQLPDTPQKIKDSIAMLRNQIEDSPGIVDHDGNPHLAVSVALVHKDH